MGRLHNSAVILPSFSSEEDGKPSAKTSPEESKSKKGGDDLEDTETEPEDDDEGRAFTKNLKARVPKKRKHRSELAFGTQTDASVVEPEIKRTKSIDTRTAFDRMLMETPQSLAARAGARPSSRPKPKVHKRKATPKTKMTQPKKIRNKKNKSPTTKVDCQVESAAKQALRKPTGHSRHEEEERSCTRKQR